MTTKSGAALSDPRDGARMGDDRANGQASGRRRTQAERSADTRARVCEATLDALVDIGYERISTQEIARRAGLSRGALTHQFPTRDALFIAAYEWLIRAWEENEPFASAKIGQGRPLTFPELADEMWLRIFRTERYIAALELMLAARKDAAISSGVHELMHRWTRLRDGLTTELLGLSPDDPHSATLVQLNLCVLRGIAVHKSFETDPDSAERLLSEWKRILAALPASITAGAPAGSGA
ncbi:TetR/AcrR family transcriptional regulator [Acuticoccus kandeliae]|uniref:TetR/AcrR family transcriptional regulator n=1 Tax=Acuticoccus kandeliae TaxID=2073160 RepID=UPI0013004F10|nr:TetR/AcrR family transcriptional regulator [Acuticoccus kandeliae]